MKKINYSEDYLNERHIRNEYNTDYDDYNCGGYALKTFNWYRPYAYDKKNYPWRSLMDRVEYLVYNEGFDKEEAVSILLEEHTKKMLEQFAETLRVVSLNTHLEEGEELIAYRLAVLMDGEYIDDIDFHYIVFRAGKWRSKLGRQKIKPFQFTEKPWKTEYFVYDSPIVYLAHKI